MERTVLFYGDSNTYGYDPRGFGGARYPADIRWTDRLAASLAGSWKIISCGLNGRCIPVLKYERRYLDQLLQNAGRLDLFAVMLGTNDVILTPRPDADTAIRKMDAFLEYLRSKEEPDRVLLIAPPGMPEEAAALEGYRPYASELKKLSSAYHGLAVKYGILFADADTWQIPMAYDQVHLSEEGHRLFARHIEEILRSVP